MKLAADRHALHAALQQVGSIITSTIARPIYQSVKLDARGDSVYLSATDLEIGLMARVLDVEIEQEGVVLVPHARVAAILGATPDETVSLVGDAESVTIKSSDSTFRIVAEDPSDFRDVPTLSDGATVEVDPRVLEYMVRHTSFAVADERGGRFALNGLLFSVDEQGNAELVGADGARMANVKKKTSNPDGISINCIVMKKGMEQCARLGRLSEKPLRIQVTDTEFLAENDLGRLCCQLVEGKFPNYREVIPRESKIKIEMPTVPFLSALRRAAFLTSEQSKAVEFHFSRGELVLNASAPDVGEGEVRMPVEYEGEKVSITFNPEYVEEMLRTIDRENVRMEFSDSRSPCLLRSGTDYMYVVSPVVQEEAVR